MNNFPCCSQTLSLSLVAASFFFSVSLVALSLWWRALSLFYSQMRTVRPDATPRKDANRSDEMRTISSGKIEPLNQKDRSLSETDFPSPSHVLVYSALFNYYTSQLTCLCQTLFPTSPSPPPPSLPSTAPAPSAPPPPRPMPNPPSMTLPRRRSPTSPPATFRWRSSGRGASSSSSSGCSSRGRGSASRRAAYSTSSSADSKYSRVRNWTLDLEGGRDQIAIIRASGSISRTSSGFSGSSSSIVADQLIEKIRSTRESERYKAVILRIDSPGGDALASDLMWREIRLLSESIPVIASMSDVAASGGYYMAMAAQAIVAEKLTLTGSIGVVTGKFSLDKLYERIGFNKEIISRGKYAELNAAEQRPFRPEEAELFAKSAQNAYKSFRDKAAVSRSMAIDQMEEVAQGRVWSGKDAASHGLVDAIGGFRRAVAIAKQKANIPQDKPVRLVELSKPSLSVPELLSGIGSFALGLNGTAKDLLQSLTSSSGVQARMEGILFEREGASDINLIVALLKDYLSAL